MHTYTHTHRQTRTHTHIHTGTFLHQTNISLHSQTKWGNRSKLFAYKLMKYYWVKLSWMLITKVMHYLLINGSSLFWAKRWYEQVDDRCGDKKRWFQWMEVSRCMENALVGSEKYMQEEGARTAEERRGGNKGGEWRWEAGMRIHCWEANGCVKLSGHGHTPQILVLLEWVKWKCIIHL